VSGPWFAPKRYGLGSGLPLTWQGWALYGAMAAGCALVAALSDAHSRARTIGLLVCLLAPMPLIALKTRGGWRWRWRWGDAD
jgi:hypothetical protein